MPSCAQLLRLSLTAVSLVQVLCDRAPANVSSGASPRVWQSFGSTSDDARCTSATSYQTWILSIAAACVVGLSGIFPLVLVPVDAGLNWKQNRKGSRTLKLLLSFAVGGLLGDVFLHLLPEAWGRLQKGLSPRWPKARQSPIERDAITGAGRGSQKDNNGRGVSGHLCLEPLHTST